MNQTACRSCGAAIVWAKSEKSGKPMPLDAEPCERGNVIVRMGPSMGDATAHVETRAETEARRPHEIPAARLAYVPHFATCVHASRHRRAKS